VVASRIAAAAGVPVSRQEGRACEADKDSVWHHRFHHPMELATLRPVTFIDEYKDLAEGGARLRLQIFNKGIEIINIATSELVHKGAHQSRSCLAQQFHRVAAAAGAANVFTCFGKDALDLFVEFVTVGDDGNAGVWVIL